MGLTELLMHWEIPFIARRFAQVLDVVVTLLQLSSKKKDESYFEVDESS